MSRFPRRLAMPVAIYTYARNSAVKLHLTHFAALEELRGILIFLRRAGSLLLVHDIKFA